MTEVYFPRKRSETFAAEGEEEREEEEEETEQNQHVSKLRLGDIITINYNLVRTLVDNKGYHIRYKLCLRIY
jgi:hypothetical protein